MKKIMCSLMLLMWVLIFLMLVGCCMSSKAQKGAYGEKIARYFQFFSPADDLYDPLVLMPISLMSETSYDFDFVHNYIGDHAFSLLLPKLKNMEWVNSEACDYELFVIISNGSNTIVSKYIRGCEGFMCFYSQSSNGIILFRYSLPKNFPLDETVHCHFEIRKTGPIFVEQYGEPTIRIRKISPD